MSQQTYACRFVYSDSEGLPEDATGSLPFVPTVGQGIIWRENKHRVRSVVWQDSEGLFVVDLGEPESRMDLRHAQQLMRTTVQQQTFDSIERDLRKIESAAEELNGTDRATLSSNLRKVAEAITF